MATTHGTTDVMIHCENLTKRYEAFVAVDRISFQVHRGEVVGFLGPNGAGKSTTMRILTCFISATSGVTKVHGFDVFEDPLEVRRRIGYLPQRAPLYPEMTVHEYLDFCADMRQIPDGARAKARRRVVEVCGLRSFYSKEIRALSHGQRQRVGLGQALLHDPPLLILDEPTADLDPNEKREFLTYVRDIGEARTVILSTHNIAEVEFACSRTLIIANRDGKGGRIVADGPVEAVRASGGRIRYMVSAGVRAGGGTVSGHELRDALKALPGTMEVNELASPDGKSAKCEVLGAKDADLRLELTRVLTDKGWAILELSRELPPLEEVFRELTIGEDRRDRFANAIPA